MTRLEILKDTIKKANYYYYNTDEPMMTDSEYDSLVEELQELDKNFYTVGSVVLDSLNKVELIDRPMLSLEKVYTSEEIEALGNGKLIVGSIKYDGLSTRLIYENGELVQAITRGDGKVGADVTEHMKQVSNIPKYIDKMGRYVVDGETIIKLKDFEEVNKNNEYKNPRNLAAGTLNSLDTSLVKERKLSWVLWDVIIGSDADTYTKRLCEAYNLGFEMRYYLPEVPINECNKIIMEEAKELFGYPCDGVVWRIDDIKYGESLGMTAHHFKNAKAWKPSVESYETTLLDIEWTMGRTGKLTPIAIFESLDIDGSEISRASLHNVTMMTAVLGKTPFKGQKIWVYKANLIIPQVLKAEHLCSIEIDDVIEMPDVCPICGEELIITCDNESEFLYCTNSSCDGKLINQLDHAFGKNGLDIKGLSKATLEKLIDWGWVNEPADIFNLEQHAQEWKNKIGFGEKSVNNILAAIEASKTTDFISFISAIGIPLIGKNVAKELNKYFSSYEEFKEAINNGYKFYDLPSFGEAKHNNIINFNYEKADRLSQYINIENVSTVVEDSGIKNLIFVVTGSLKKFKNRDEIKAYIEQHGGKLTGSISSKTNYLINNDTNSSSSKNLKAKSLGVPIISEEEFMQMI